MIDGAAPVEFRVGDRQSFSKTITESDISSYAGVTGDFHPMHVDDEYARKSRFGRRTAHRLLAGGLIASVLSTRLPGPAADLLSFQLEFLAPVFIGDTVTAWVEVTAWQPTKRLITLRTDCTNQDGQQVVTGQAVLSVNLFLEGGAARGSVHSRSPIG